MKAKAAEKENDENKESKENAKMVTDCVNESVPEEI